MLHQWDRTWLLTQSETLSNLRSKPHIYSTNIKGLPQGLATITSAAIFGNSQVVGPQANHISTWFLALPTSDMRSSASLCVGERPWVDLLVALAIIPLHTYYLSLSIPLRGGISQNMVEQLDDKK